MAWHSPAGLGRSADARHRARRLALLHAAIAVFVALTASTNLTNGLVVFGPETYVRKPGLPVTVVSTFKVNPSSGSFSLTVINHGVTSAEVTLNGRTILRPADFAGHIKDGTLTRQVSLKSGSNVIGVELRSKAGTYFVLSIVRNPVANTPPVADAGPDQTVALNTPVQLTGAASSDADGNPLKYLWSFESRPSRSNSTLSNPTSLSPTFVADVPGTYVIRLVVNDGKDSSAPDTVSVSTINSAPVANAGPDQSAPVGTPIVLDASGSTDVDGDMLTYGWTLLSAPAGSGASLIDATALHPTFVIDVSGTYVFQLLVNDGLINSAPDTVVVTTTNSAPVANAGADRTAAVNATVTLDGSGSTDVDGNTLTYFWSLISVPAGSTARLSDLSAVRPTFIVDHAGTYVAQLIVNDGMLASAPDTVTVTTTNSPPAANAGPDQSAIAGRSVTLDGSGSFDPDGDVLTYQWSLTAVPAGSTATLSNPTSARPSFVVDLPGTYVAQLVVRDSVVGSAPDTVTITTTNSAPTANAGPDQSHVAAGQPVTLDGSASNDPDGHVLSYSWALLARPPTSNATLNNAATAQPTFTPDVPGDYVAQLIVSDGFVNSAPDTVLIRTNGPPIANAGADQSAIIGATVTLHGDASSDPDGDTLSFSWTFNSVPPGSTALIQYSNTATPSFAPDRPGEYILELTVTDSVGAGAVDSVTVTVAALNVVSVSAIDAAAAEAGADQATFAISRTGDLSNALDVFYSLSGSATAGVDYATLPGVATIPAGQSTATVTVTPIDDSMQENAETVLLTLSANAAYVVGIPDTAIVGIADNDTPAINLAPVITSQPTLSWNWLRLSPTGARPSPRGSGSSPQTYDSASDRLITFSGPNGVTTPSLTDAWALTRSSTFTLTGALNEPRAGSSVTVLPNGKVLLIGGTSTASDFRALASAEIYDPATGVFTLTGSMIQARSSHSATLLQNGKVLVVGGSPADHSYGTGSALASVELYDPATGQFSPAASLRQARIAHGAALLNNGKVLIAGGDNNGRLTSAELYDPATNTFAFTGNLTEARYGLRLFTLADGTVFVYGGNTGQSPTIERYYPTTGTFAAVGQLSKARGSGTSTLLPNGDVLVTGPDDTADLYHPQTDTVTPTGKMSAARYGASSVLLRSGKVLIVGGLGTSLQPPGFTYLKTAELYDPLTSTFTPTAGMNVGGHYFTPTLLPDGRVLVAGGYASALVVTTPPGYREMPTGSAEVFDENDRRPTWIELGPLNPTPPARSGHAIAFASNVNRLIVQGGNGSGIVLNDTWALTNGNGLGGAPAWIRLADAPFTRRNASGVFDSASNRFIVFGGSSSLSVATNESWALAGAGGTGAGSWIQLAPAGTLPPARELHSAAYDSGSNRLMVFAGRNGPDTLDDLWILENANGSTGTSAWAPISVTGAKPPPRFGHTAVYETASNQLFVFGGRDAAGAAFDDVWVLSHANGLGGEPSWMKLETTGASPLARAAAAMGAAPDAEQLIVALGDGFTTNPSQHPIAKQTYLNDAWTLRHSTRVRPGETFTYGVSATDPNVGDTLTFSLTSAPQGMSVNTATGVIQWNPTSGQIGDYEVIVRVSDNGGLSAAQSFRITVSVDNRAPVVDAGVDQTTTTQSPTPLAGTVTDDGYPEPLALVTRWSVVSGPGTVSFSNASSPSTSAEFSSLGVYSLRLSADDGQFIQADDVRVTVGQPVPVVSVVASTPQALEAGTAPGLITFTRSNEQILSPLTVFYAVQGTALSGIDFEPLSGTVVIPAGQTSATVTVRPIDDAAAEDTETIAITVQADSSYAIAGSGSAVVLVLDNDFHTPSQSEYIVTPFESLPGGGGTLVRAMNAFGDAVGTLTGADGLFHVVRWRNAVVEDVPNLFGLVPQDMNDRGDILAFSSTSSGGFRHWLYSNGDLVDIGVAGSQNKASVNNHGEVVGQTAAGRAYLYSQGTLQELPSLGGACGDHATDINDAGLIVGGSCLSGTTNAVPVFWRNRMISRLPLPPGYTIGGAVAVNERGLISGGISAGGGQPGRGAVWVPDGLGGYSVASIGILPGFLNSYGGSIGASGQIAGNVSLNLSGTPARGFVYDAFHGIRDLNDLVSHTPPAFIQDAGGFSDAGQIAAYGTFNGASGGLLLTPIGATKTEVSVSPSPVVASATAHVTARVRNADFGATVTAPSGTVALTTLDGSIDYRACTLAANSGSQEAICAIDIVVAPSGPQHLNVDYFGDPSHRSSHASLELLPTSNPPNRPPTVDAGPDLTTTLPNGVTLAGSVVDDGLPANQTLSVTWSQISGPGAVSFAVPTASTTTATFSTPGTYTLRLTASDSQLTGSDDITVTVAAMPLLSSVLPDTAVQGEVQRTVTIIGVNTHFTNASVIDLGPGILVASVQVIDAAHLSIGLTIASDASIGFRTLTVRTGSEIAVLSAALYVSSGVPEIVSVVSDTGRQGGETTVTITGRFTNFSSGQTTASFGQGVSVGGAPAAEYGPVLVTSPTTAIATIRVNSAGHWTKLQPSGPSPGRIFGHSTVYDPASDQLIIYGGYDGLGTRFSEPIFRVTNASGTGPSQWIRASTGGDLPGPRSAHTAVYDARSDRMIVFGGGAGDYAPILNEVHVLINASGAGGPSSWIRLTPPDPKPLPRIWHSAAYDSINNRMIIFSGRRGDAEYFDDVWILTNANGLGGPPQWIQLPITGPTPGARGPFGGIAYDETTNRLLLWTYSQTDPSRAEIWTLSNANGMGGDAVWSQQPTTTAPASSFHRGKIGYDSVSNTAVGPFSCSSLLVTMENANAVSAAPSPSRHGPFESQPSPRCQESGNEYDPSTDQLFVVGGGHFGAASVIGSQFDEVWVLKSVARAAALGVRNVRVRTGNEQVVKKDVFRIAPVAGPPGFMLWRDWGFAGLSMTAEIRSANADFVEGVSAARWGPGISVGGAAEGDFGPLTVVAPNRALARLTISPAAAVALRDVTVRINGSDFLLPGYFFVMDRGAGGLRVPTLAPISGNPGQQISIQVTDTNARFQQGVTRLYFGDGVAVQSVTVQSPTTLIADLLIAPDAEIGPRDVAIVYVGGLVTPFPFDQYFVLHGAFAVLNGESPPSLISVSPSMAAQGSVVQIAVSGHQTHFVQGSTQLNLGPGVAVNALTVTSPTSLSAHVVVSPTAPLGSRAVSVTTGSEIISLANGFSVLADTTLPKLSLVAPTSGRQGQGGPVTIIGQNTHFAQGITQVDLGPGITVGAVTVSCATCLETSIAIADTASTGPRAVRVVTGTEVATLPNAFTVNPGTPILTSLNPASGRQGQTLSIHVTGQFTHFDQATTRVDLGSGIETTGVAVASATDLTAQIAIASGAAVGQRTLTVATGAETVSVANVFTVQQAPVVNQPPHVNAGVDRSVLLPKRPLPSSYTLTFLPDLGGGTSLVGDINDLAEVVGWARSSTGQQRPVIWRAGSVFDLSTGTNGFAATIGINGWIGGQTTGLGQEPGQSFLINGGSPIYFAATGCCYAMDINRFGDLVGQANLRPMLYRNGQLMFLPLQPGGNNGHALGLNDGGVIAGVANINATQFPARWQDGQLQLLPTLTGSGSGSSWAYDINNFGEISGQLSDSAGNNRAVLWLNDQPMTLGPFASNNEVAYSLNDRHEVLIASQMNSGQPVRAWVWRNGATVELTPFVAPYNTLYILTSLNNRGQIAGYLGANSNDPNPRAFVLTPQATTTRIDVQLQGTISDDGLPGPPLGILWSLVSGPGTVAFSESSAATTTATFSQPGRYVLRLSANDSAASSSDDVTIAVAPDPEDNEAPTVDAGAPQTIDVSSGASLEGSASDDGLPLSGALTYRWWKLNGPGSVTFSAPDQLTTTALFSTAGTYTLRLVVNDGVLSNADDVTIVVNDVPGSPVLTGIAPTSAQQGQQNVGVTVTGQNTHFVQGVTTVSLGGAGIVINSVTVTSPTTLIANASLALNALLGARPLIVTTGAEIVGLANAFTVQQATNHAPTITIAPTWSVTLPARLTLNYSVTDDGLPLGGALTVSWEGISGPGNFGFQNQTPTSISVGFDQAGIYVLRITATDTQFTVSADVTVTVNAPIAAPVVSITTPSDGAEITSRVNVVGNVVSAALASWTLEFRSQGEPAFRTLGTGSTPVTNGVLGTFDPTLLLNGLAEIRLRAIDAAGQTSVFGPITVVVTQNQKIGNFTVSFNDLTVPVAGLPIQIVRTYDSRDKRPGDFGVGWRLDLNSVAITTTGPLGDNWTGTSSGGLIPNLCIVESRPHLVTVSFSDGTVFQFRPTLNPNCQQLIPLSQTTVTFAPVSTTPPNASLAVIGNSDPYVAGNFPGPVDLLDLDQVSTFDPQLYRLTMPDGRVLIISTQSGLQTMSDPNGNVLTITPSGVTHSSGKGVAFQRDASNRITQITDPAGNTIHYAYNAQGDLASVTDAGSNITTFTYNATHGLLTIVDPRGVQPIRNVYDDSGRLIQHVDAFGNTIDYTHDLNTRQEIVRDRLGNLTVNEYDDRGNVVRVTDARGGVTQRTYDSRNNLLTETNPLNETRAYTYDANNNRLAETDPLGNTTTYTYNARNQVLTIRDALGRVTSNTYDASGNMTQTTDPMGRVTTNVYDSRGLRTSVTDPVGNVTTYQYDGSGNLTRQTDALGHATNYTYDANGNRITESKTQTTSSGVRTVLTQYQYDAQNRLTRTIYPDGSFTRNVYNAIGKQASTFDQLGRQTNYTYDLMGRLTSTAFPDGTAESSTYDAEGHRLTSTDRAGRITRYTYDGLGRLTSTTFADNAVNSTQYNAAGQVIVSTDARGNSTSYAYDAAGRRTSVTDALGHVTSFAYDAAGNQTSITDANGHTTQFQYDANNRRLRTVYPDSTVDAVAYDTLGRTTSKIDQAGVLTRFEYDALGRLTAVLDALNQRTSYGYDELGNRTAQTDANNHATTFAYDLMGRRVGRTLPLGVTETFTYDSAGNLSTKADFNGRTTTLAYDTANRLTTKTPDPVLVEPTVRFSYNAAGQRTQMVDASGTTNYSYDVRGRLTTKATPQGTLTYTYDTASNLTSIRSSNTGGTSVDYAYDALNRLSTVTDNRLASGVTTYAYDNVGNLASFHYPNGVTHGYTYNTLNRLTDLAVTNSTTTLASYAYTLGATGNRTRVLELGGRTVDYTYDALYRLTAEAITGAPGGTTTYAYDPAGNRLARSSPTFGLMNYNYNANDRLTTDAYDANGNTTASGGNSYAYDFENHLTSQNGGDVSIVYDGDGNRVAKTVGSLTTHYLVDDRNLTGHAQVMEELSAGVVSRVYAYGLSRISLTQLSGTSFYGYDGHANVRDLIDPAAAVTDSYDYDGFGNTTRQVGNSQNVYQYSGEQWDPNIGLYYLRARYMDPASGRFTIPDPLEGDAAIPSTLHKYLYAADDPVNKNDPSGQLFVEELGFSAAWHLLSESVRIGAGTILNKFSLSVEEGDVIMRLGADDAGLWPATQSLGIAFASSGPYSHIGIVVHVDTNDPLNSRVRHSYHGVQESTVREFMHGGGSIGPSIPGGVYSNIFRFNGPDSVRKNAARAARNLNGPYDQAYDLSDTQEGNRAYYCSEFVWKAYGGSGADIAGGNRTTLNGLEFAVAKRLHPQLSTREFVTPNDIYFSGMFMFATK